MKYILAVSLVVNVALAIGLQLQISEIGVLARDLSDANNLTSKSIKTSEDALGTAKAWKSTAEECAAILMERPEVKRELKRMGLRMIK